MVGFAPEVNGLNPPNLSAPAPLVPAETAIELAGNFFIREIGRPAEKTDRDDADLVEDNQRPSHQNLVDDVRSRGENCGNNKGQ